MRLRLLILSLFTFAAGCHTTIPCQESVISLKAENSYYSSGDQFTCGPGAALEKLSERTYKCVCAAPTVEVPLF